VFTSNIPDPSSAAGFVKALERRKWEDAFGILAPVLVEPPFPASVMACIVHPVDEIIKIEAARGDIARAERSALDPKAQPYQDLIDRILYRMAGLTDTEAMGLEKRLEEML
jgi:hypothetical protein